MSNQIPTKEALNEWLDHPVTRQFRTLLIQFKYVLQDQWSGGCFKDEPEGNAAAIGQCELLDKLYGIDHEQWSNSYEDESDESVGDTPGGSSGPGEAT